ncbi:MAG TPA: hypothetical protein VGY58_24120, partial [Gemmataceae bacterium]|nr:hypothetical protein [Gemmataceae bacterium]
MDALLQVGLSNALVATILALLAAVIGRVCRRPALVHCLWLLVLIKLLTPSFLPYRIPWPQGAKANTANATALQARNTLAPSARALEESNQQADKSGEDATEIPELSSATVAPQPAEAKPRADSP